jgi:hypothetical protein
VCYMPSPSFPLFYCSINIWCRVSVQIMNLLIMHFSSSSSFFLSLRSKHSPQHPVLKHPSHNVREHVHKTVSKIIVLCILIFASLERRWENKRLNWTVTSIPWIYSAISFVIHS